jgi:hypothetical protein
METNATEVSDIFVVLKKPSADTMDQSVDELRKLGLQITSVDPDEGVLEGTLPVDKLVDLKGCQCVETVRIDFTYISERSSQEDGPGE